MKPTQVTVNGKQLNVIAVMKNLGHKYAVDGNLETGTVYKVTKAGAETAEWPEWAVQNLPGYIIDRAFHSVAKGKVRCIDETFSQLYIKIRTAPNGVKFSV